MMILFFGWDNAGFCCVRPRLVREGRVRPRRLSGCVGRPRPAGHHCIQVRLDWLGDVNPDNNVGGENTIVADGIRRSERQHPAHQRAPGDWADDAVYGH